jgi:uncharacterized membrane protein YvlD (DUF360 family)
MAEALLRGLSAILRPRLLLIYWLLSVLLALPVVGAGQAVLFEGTSQLPEPEAFAAEPAAPWVDDLARTNAPALTALSSSAGVVVWLWILATTMLAGGLVKAFERRAVTERRERGEAWGLRVFLGDAGRFALRMLRLLAVTLVIAFAWDWLCNTILVKQHEQWLTAVEDERVTVVSDWLRQWLFAGGLFLLATWTDLARVQVVLERRGSVLAGLVSAANALLQRPMEVLGLGAFFVVVEWIAMALGAIVLGRIRTDSLDQLGWWLLGAQVLILLRLGLGFARIAAFTAIGEDLREERETRLTPSTAPAA